MRKKSKFEKKLDFCPITLQTKSLSFSAKLKMEKKIKSRFTCKPENRMHEVTEMWMKQILECNLIP